MKISKCKASWRTRAFTALPLPPPDFAFVVAIFSVLGMAEISLYSIFASVKANNKKITNNDDETTSIKCRRCVGGQRVTTTATK